MLFGKRERAISRILIVEDEPLVAFDNEHLLGEAGYEVVATVDSLADAREALDGNEIDLVLSDITLNGDGDGLDVARAAGMKGVPVLFLTGHCPDEARGLGMGWLAKPYTSKMLRSALDAVDRKLQGRAVKRVPAGLSLYEPG
jgi:DNA-binding response OmpR family regulator